MATEPSMNSLRGRTKVDGGAAAREMFVELKGSMRIALVTDATDQ